MISLKSKWQKIINNMERIRNKRWNRLRVCMGLVAFCCLAVSGRVSIGFSIGGPSIHGGQISAAACTRECHREWIPQRMDGLISCPRRGTWDREYSRLLPTYLSRSPSGSRIPSETMTGDVFGPVAGLRQLSMWHARAQEPTRGRRLCLGRPKRDKMPSRCCWCWCWWPSFLFFCNDRMLLHERNRVSGRSGFRSGSN